jgi:hypothetical protein
LLPCESFIEDEEAHLLGLLHEPEEQVRGQYQDRDCESRFKKKDVHLLSWRGYIQYLYENNRVMVCECDEKPKPTYGAMIKHIERNKGTSKHDYEKGLPFTIKPKGK